MAIINIKINTDSLGDTPEVKINGRDVKVLYHIDFNWTTSKESVPSISKLNIKHWPDYMYGYHPLSYWDEHLNHLNDVVIKDFTWETASHQSVNNKDGD
ncbi:hypothetical protein DN448_03200 [Lactobacillus reuteri]|nr:hypothetical protein [Limosilactobacillus reuteri]